MQETWVWSLGREDPLEKGIAPHSSILAWRMPWIEEPGWPKVCRVAKSQDWATNVCFPGVLGHHTSEFFSPLLRVWLWGWGICFELWCPIFLFLEKFYFRQSPGDTMKVKLISSGNQALGPHGTDSSCCLSQQSAPSPRPGLACCSPGVRVSQHCWDGLTLFEPY